MNDLSFVKEVWERRASIARYQRSRGMSSVALANLRVVRELAPPMPSRTVLATRRDVIAEERACRIVEARAFSVTARKIRDVMPRKAGEFLHATIKLQDINRPNKPARSGILEPQRVARVKAIVWEVAQAAGVEASQLLAYKSPRRLSAPKHMAVYLVAMLTDVSIRQISKIFGYDDEASARYGIQKTAFCLRNETATVVELHSRALTAIRARWPEYQP